eukprot:1103021-Rhodomonas_salina.1
MVIRDPPVDGAFWTVRPDNVGAKYENTPEMSEVSRLSTVTVASSSTETPAGIRHSTVDWLTHSVLSHDVSPMTATGDTAVVPKLAPVSVIVSPPDASKLSGNTEEIVTMSYVRVPETVPGSSRIVTTELLSRLLPRGASA